MKIKKEIIRNIEGEITSIKEFDKYGNMIYIKRVEVEHDFETGKNKRVDYEAYYKYDKLNRLIEWKDTDDYGQICQYDSNGNTIYVKDLKPNFEKWMDYDKNGNVIHFKNSKGVEWWKKYNDRGNVIANKFSPDREWVEYKFDDNGNQIHNSYEYEFYEED